MKFSIGDSTDKKLVAGLEDEAMKCVSAFAKFERLAAGNANGVVLFQKPSHDAYVNFIQHLYEFHKGCFIRERLDTCWFKRSLSKKPEEVMDDAFSVEAWRLLSGIISSIEKGFSPSLENSISYYEQLLLLVERKNTRSKVGKLIPDFGKALRDVRNHHGGHVTTRRPEISVLEFYRKYHGLICLLNRNVYTWNSSAGNGIGSDFKLSSLV